MIFDAKIDFGTKTVWNWTCSQVLKRVTIGSRSPKKFFCKKYIILCEKSTPHIPEAWKRFLDPDSGKESVYWSENQTFSDFYEKTVYIQGVSKVRKHLNFSIKICLFIITHKQQLFKMSCRGLSSLLPVSSL